MGRRPDAADDPRQRQGIDPERLTGDAYRIIQRRQEGSAAA
ncbi:hypothetical protein [Paenibacillus sp. BK033]|nr:hypothetical protein [Paenibacillus sp. BK033]